MAFKYLAVAILPWIINFSSTVALLLFQGMKGKEMFGPENKLNEFYDSIEQLE